MLREILLLTILFTLSFAGFAQTDSSGNSIETSSDTLMPLLPVTDSAEVPAVLLDSNATDSLLEGISTDSVSVDSAAQELEQDSVIQGEGVTDSLDVADPDSLFHDLESETTAFDSVSVIQIDSADSAKAAIKAAKKLVRKAKIDSVMNRFYYGMYFSPELNVVRINRFPSSTAEYQTGFQGRFSTGLYTGYLVFDKLSVELGVGYGLKALRFKSEGQLEPVDGEPEIAGVTAGTSLERVFRWQEVQIPVALRWECWKDRLSVSAGYEVQYQFDIISEVQYFLTNNQREGTGSVPDRWNASPTLGVQYIHPIDDRFVLRIEPTLKPYIRYFDFYTRRGQLMVIGLKAGVTL